MKITRFLLALSVFGSAACSTPSPAHLSSAKADPETVLVTYHVKPGKEGEFQTVLWQAWKIYRGEHLTVKHCACAPGAGT